LWATQPARERVLLELPIGIVKPRTRSGLAGSPPAWKGPSDAHDPGPRSAAVRLRAPSAGGTVARAVARTARAAAPTVRVLRPDPAPACRRKRAPRRQR
jgi:hypothetical protein